MKRDDSSPASYIESVDEPQKALLLRIRKLIQSAAPGAAEGIQYGMLEYENIANLAAQKNYVSLYVSPKALAEFSKEYSSANCGKSCLRFSSAAQFEKLGDEAITKLIQSVLALPEDERGC